MLKKDKKQLYKLIETARRYPVIGARKLLNVDFIPIYQEDMLERGWGKKNVVYLCSRRTGKTFIVAVILTLKACLYEQMKIGITAPVYRQAQTLFLEIEDIFNRSPFVQLMANDEPKHGNAEWHLDFTNGSRISALPFGDSIRSKGFHIVVIDEYGFEPNMNTKRERIIDPMLHTKRSLKISGDLHPTDVGNQLFVISTATFKWNDYYNLVQEYKEKMQKGSNDYDVISFDYRDGLESGLFDEERVKQDIENADSLTKKMEYLNIFADSTDGFITYKLLQDRVIDTDEIVDEENDKYIPPKTQVEFEQPYDENGNPKYKYLLAFDDADSGNNNFALALIKLDGKTKRFVRLEAMNKAAIQEKIKLIRKILRRFNVVRMVGDQRHKNIVDNLAEPYEYSDGETAPAILLEKGNDDSNNQLNYVLNRFGKNVDYERLIKIHNFSGNTNEERARHLLSEIEKNRVKMPAPIKVQSKKEEEIYNEFKKTIAEITAIQPKTSGKYIKYEPSSASMNKDRWTVTELGVYMADEYIKELTNTTSSDDVVMGVWNE